MANAGTFTGRSPLSESVQNAAAQRARRNDETDRLVFDRLTQLVSALLDVPVSLLLVADEDQLLFASNSGTEDPWVDLKRLPISEAYCQHALSRRAVFTVEDSQEDPLVCDLIPTTELGVVAYLGVPLLTSDGEPIGSLCAIDFEPRTWTETEIRVVEDLAATVMAYIEARPREQAGERGGLNIAAVSHRTGVAADTLRKWERRYGVLHPRRTPGGQRRYDDIDVARVEWLRDRLSEGIRIGTAAALLEPASGDSVETIEELRRALVDAAHEGEPTRLSRLVERIFTLQTFAVAIEEIVAPALRAVGDAWATGSDTIAGEHQLSEAVRARLERMLSDGRPGPRGTAVLACGPGERHELGLLAVAVMLQAEGWRVAYLGADAPVESALSLARQLEADVVCLSVTLPESVERLAAELAAAAADGPPVVAGGPGIVGATELPAQVITGGLADAVARLHAA